MGLFDQQIKQVQDFLSEKQSRGQLRQFQPGSYRDWPLESTLVLEEDAALELGNPGVGSLSFLIWSEAKAETEDRILLIGPDLKEAGQKSIPFCQIVRVSGRFRDEYECYCQLRDAVLNTRLKGFMTRTLPSQQTLWCRVNQEALDKGFSLAHLAAALIKNLKKIEFVSAAELIFVTSGKQDLEQLKAPACDAERVVAALMKMVEEESFDCASCDFQEVCDVVEELKMIRKKLQKGATRQ